MGSAALAILTLSSVANKMFVPAECISITSFIVPYNVLGILPRLIRWSALLELQLTRWENQFTFNFMIEYRKIITIEPGKRSGKPCIRGLRITVGDVLDYLAGGMTVEEILDDFPDLTRDDILACFAFAADRERNVFPISPP